MSLIYNYFFKKDLLPIANYIIGPQNISYHYIPSLNKRIYVLIGREQHVYFKEHECDPSLHST